MLTSAGIAARPFQVCVQARTCDCRLPAKELSRHKRIEKAILTIGGYWNVYVAFFGDQTFWLEFLVIDLRDGVVVWRNGRHLKEEENAGKIDTAETAERHDGTGRVGRWLAGGSTSGGW